MGYFQTLWFWLWGIIKKSFTYRILHGFYEWISRSWQQSVLASTFRRKWLGAYTAAKSILCRFLKIPFTFLEFLQRKIGTWLDGKIKGSLLISVGSTYLHNLLAVNLKYIGVVLTAFSVTSIVLGFLGFGSAGVLQIALLVLGILLFFINVNVTECLKGSGIVKFISLCLGTELSFDFYKKDLTEGNKRLLTAIPFGIIAGAASAFLGPILGIGVLAAFAGMFLILYSATAGVFFTVLLTPIVPTMAVVGLSLFCLFSLILHSICDKNFKWRIGGVGYMILGLLVIYLIAGICSFAPIKSLSIFCVYFALMSFYFIVINTLKSKKQIFDLLTVFAISGAVVSVYGLLQYLFGWNINQAWMDEEMFGDIKMRIYSTLENPNVLGEYILLHLPICIGLMWTKRGVLPKLLYGGMAVVSFAALILTFSRGCWIGLLVAAAVFVTFAAGKLWGLLLLVLPALPVLIPESIINRFMSVGDMKDSSTSYRVFIWLGTINLLKDFWLSGIGMGTEAFTQVYPFYSYSAVVAPHAHNLFLQTWVESGIVGLIVFLGILTVFLKTLATSHKALGGKGAAAPTMMVALAAGVIGFLVQGMFDNCFYNYRVVMVFWTVLAVGVSFTTLLKESEGTE